MNKFLRVFSSQLFNAFFPILIIAILLHISNKNEIAFILIVLNFANQYLLFSDYSSNIRFVQDAMRVGGIKKNPSEEIVHAINNYLGIKSIVLCLGFIPWILISYVTPLLNSHFFASILSYSFVIGFSLNFYWIYTTSSKEYFFILSNFFSRLVLVITLLLFIYLKLDNNYLMFFAGLASSTISLFFFYRFCKIYEINFRLTVSSLKQSAGIIVSDFKLVASSFALMTPTLSLTFFLGYIQQPEQIAVYAVAEKIFLGIRTLLSVAVNSIYPVLCNKAALTVGRIQKMLMLFYVVVASICAGSYFFSPFLFQILKIPTGSFLLFRECLGYFLIVILIISINVPFMLWLMISNELQSKRTLLALTVSAFIIIIVFTANLFFWNSAVSLVQSLLIGEAIIVLAFLLLYKFRRPHLTPQSVVPSV